MAVFDDWLATRPQSVRDLAAEFPLLTSVQMPDGKQMLVIGWTEGDSLIISPVDPRTDYDGAYSARTYLCAAHLRD